MAEVWSGEGVHNDRILCSFLVKVVNHAVHVHLPEMRTVESACRFIVSRLRGEDFVKEQ